MAHRRSKAVENPKVSVITEYDTTIDQINPIRSPSKRISRFVFGSNRRLTGMHDCHTRDGPRHASRLRLLAPKTAAPNPDVGLAHVRAKPVCAMRRDRRALPCHTAQPPRQCQCQPREHPVDGDDADTLSAVAVTCAGPCAPAPYRGQPRNGAGLVASVVADRWRRNSSPSMHRSKPFQRKTQLLWPNVANLVRANRLRRLEN